MYAHIYTLTTSANRFEVWWYFLSDINRELFEDFECIFSKYKQFKEIQSYTGDVLKISDEKTFIEQLILSGINIPPTIFDILLQDKTLLHLNFGTTDLVEEFNDLYSVCFDEYDIVHTFSSDVHKKISTDSEYNNIIHVELCNKHFFSPNTTLKCIAYDTLQLNTSNNILNKWFTYFSENKPTTQYDKVCNILKKLLNENKLPFDGITNISIAENPTIEEEKSEYKKWIEEFCNLYAEKDENYDTLLSDIYEQYLIASSWTKIETIGMSQFIKYLKQLPQFNIKRKSKGMMVIGYKFLVKYQEDMFNKTKIGQLCERSLISYISNESYINKANDTIKKLQLHSIPDTYYLEAVILLGDKLQNSLTKTMLDQFINNPYIAKSLPEYSNYVKEVIKNSSLNINTEPYTLDSSFNATLKTRALNCHFNTTIGTYRSKSPNFIFYMPFSKKHIFGDCISTTNKIIKYNKGVLSSDKDIKSTVNEVCDYDADELLYNSTKESDESFAHIHDIIKGFELYKVPYEKSKLNNNLIIPYEKAKLNNIPITPYEKSKFNNILYD